LCNEEPTITYEQNVIVFYTRLLLKRKLLIISIVTFSVAISVAVALSLTPIYQSSVLVAPVSQDNNSNKLSALSSQLGGLVDVGGLGLSGGSVTDTVKSLAFLESRNFKYQIIEELNLAPLLFSELWDENTDTWLVPESEFPTLWDTHEEFEDLFSVETDTMSGLVTLKIEWDDPETAAKIASTMIKRINDKLRQAAMAKSAENLNYLYAQVKNTQVFEVKNALNQLIEMEMKTSMLANSSLEYAFKVIDPAIAPQKRIKPKRALIVILGGILGVFSSIMLVIALNTYNAFKEAD